VVPVLAPLLALVACSAGPVSVGDNRNLVGEAGGSSTPDTGPIPGDTGGEAPIAEAGTDGFGGAVMDDAGAGAETSISDAPPEAPSTVAQLLGLLAQDDCSNPVSMGDFAPTAGAEPTVKICAIGRAVYWRSGMEIACDGQVTATCNRNTDMSFSNDTVGKDSYGDPLDAAAVPYVNVPDRASPYFNYFSANIHMGSVAAVIYNDAMSYGVVGDEGDQRIIGQASYAMAASLPGINPDPAKGGVGSGVTYVVFTGRMNVVDPLEDTAQARTMGADAVTALIASQGQ
jgi:hypothetical protein